MTGPDLAPIARVSLAGRMHGDAEEVQARWKLLTGRLTEASDRLGLRATLSPVGGVIEHPEWRWRVTIQSSDCDRRADLFAASPAYDVYVVYDQHRLDAAGQEAADELTLLTRTICLPFTGSELRTVHLLNPALHGVRADAQEVFWTPSLLIIREHPLLEKLNLIDVVTRVGKLPDDQVVFIPKPDATAYRDRVLGELRARGCAVLEDAWEEQVAGLLARRPSGQRAVLLDDGGKLIRAAADQGKLPPDVVAIETNSMGVRRLSSAGLIGQVVNLSDSAEKVAANRGIAISGVHSFKVALRHRPQIGERCHVIGFGRIGEHVAEILRANGFVVTVSEPVRGRRDLADSRGFPAFESVSVALASAPHRYLLGCSGEPALSESDLSLLADGAVIGALSSGDISAALRQARAGSRWTAEPRHGDVILSDGHGSVLVLAAGHALNLHRSEGVPEPDFDEFMAHVTRTTVEAVLG